MARARKNAKILVEGGQTEGDNTTDYDLPRKRRKPLKLVSSDEEQVVLNPKKRKQRPVSDSESDSASPSIPPPVTDFDELESKVQRALALRQVAPKIANKPTAVPKGAKASKTAPEVELKKAPKATAIKATVVKPTASKTTVVKPTASKTTVVQPAVIMKTVVKPTGSTEVFSYEKQNSSSSLLDLSLERSNGKVYLFI